MEIRSPLLNFSRLELNKQIEGLGLESWKITWTVPKDLAFFEGHFPNNPILPSMIILEGSIELIQLFFENKKVVLREVRKAKFFSPIEPGTTIQIIGVMKDTEKRWTVNWFEKKEGRKLANFSLLFNIQ